MAQLIRNLWIVTLVLLVLKMAGYIAIPWFGGISVFTPVLVQVTAQGAALFAYLWMQHTGRWH